MRLRTGRIPDRRNTGQVGYRRSDIDDSRDAGQERCWTGGMQDWRNIGKA